MTALTYRREIDGLRAIAVLAVVLYHAGVPIPSGGFVGVDVFFVISGYLITSLLLREWQQHGRIDLIGFYARRVRRLLPVLWLVVATTLLAAMVLLEPAGPAMQGVLDSTAASLLFVANFYFAANSGGYFDGPADEMPLLHLWSLSVEEQYYFVVPLALIAVLWRWPHAWRTCLVIASIASFAFAEWAVQHVPSMAFYQMPARFWELGVGGWIAGSAPSRLGQRWPARLFAFGCVLTLAAVVWTPATHFPGVGALPAVVGAGLVLYALNDSDRLGTWGRVLASPAMVGVGLISYSLYLWHWPLLAFDQAVNVEASSLATRLGLCALAVALSWVSYRFVEMPFRRSSLRWPRAVVLSGAGIVSLALMGATWGLRPAPSVQPSPAESLAWATRLDHPSNMDRCHLNLNDDEVRLREAECRSDTTKPPNVLIWGDSHALAWQPLAWELARARGGSAVSFTLDSCPPVVDYSSYRADFPMHRDHCRRFNDQVLDYIAAHRIDTLIMNGRWLVYLEAAGPESLRLGHAPRHVADTLAVGLDQALARVSSQVGQVIILAPPPQLRDNAPKCIASGQVEACAMPRPEYDRRAENPRRLLHALAAKYHNLTVVDPADFFCNAQQCPVMRDGYALFWDDDHVASRAARAFAKAYVADPARWDANRQ